MGKDHAAAEHGDGHPELLVQLLQLHLCRPLAAPVPADPAALCTRQLRAGVESLCHVPGRGGGHMTTSAGRDWAYVSKCKALCTVDMKANNLPSLERFD